MQQAAPQEPPPLVTLAIYKKAGVSSMFALLEGAEHTRRGLHGHHAAATRSGAAATCDCTQQGCMPRCVADSNTNSISNSRKGADLEHAIWLQACSVGGRHEIKALRLEVHCHHDCTAKDNKTISSFGVHLESMSLQCGRHEVQALQLQV